MIKVTTTAEAWEVAYKIADFGEYELDKDSQERAGYPIYRAKESYYSRICDLGCRLEVMKADGTSTNIWIEPQEPAAEEPTHYGNTLAEKIRETTTDFSKISHFDKFVLDRGYKYKTEEELKVACSTLQRTEDLRYSICLCRSQTVQQPSRQTHSPHSWYLQ